MTWTEIILYAIFITAICAFALLGVMKTDATGNKLHMTDKEVSHVMKNLERRSAADCVLTRVEGGFICKELGSNKVFRVKM